MKCLDAIEKRCSVREFSNKKVPWDKVIEAIDAANHAPFAGNINNLRYIIVQDKDKIETITACCQQGWVRNASYVVVVCADTGKIEDHYGDRGYLYSKQQVGAAIENFLLRITELKLASCWIGAFTNDKLRILLNIPENYDIEAILPIGYPNPNYKKQHKQAKKRPVDKKIYWDKWMKPRKPTAFKDPRE